MPTIKTLYTVKEFAKMFKNAGIPILEITEQDDVTDAGIKITETLSFSVNEDAGYFGLTKQINENKFLCEDFQRPSAAIFMINMYLKTEDMVLLVQGEEVKYIKWLAENNHPIDEGGLTQSDFIEVANLKVGKSTYCGGIVEIKRIK